MLLYIDDHETVGDLQEKFNECFPHLKIEFYQTMHHWGKSSPGDQQIDPDTRLQDVIKNHTADFFEIKSTFKTGIVEQEFRHKYGLFVQIFYLQNNQWVQSTDNDDDTLAQLNEITPYSGRSSS